MHIITFLFLFYVFDAVEFYNCRCYRRQLLLSYLSFIEVKTN